MVPGIINILSGGGNYIPTDGALVDEGTIDESDH